MGVDRFVIKHSFMFSSLSTLFELRTIGKNLKVNKPCAFSTCLRVLSVKYMKVCDCVCVLLLLSEGKDFGGAAKF